jgi:hypothetical protein
MTPGKFYVLRQRKMSLYSVRARHNGAVTYVATGRLGFYLGLASNGMQRFLIDEKVYEVEKPHSDLFCWEEVKEDEGK